MSEAANAAGGASAPTAIVNGSTKREYVPTPKVQAPTQSKDSSTQKADDPFAAFKGTKHKVTIDGKPAEVDYETLVRDYQIRQASDRRFQEASQKEKQAAAIQSALERGDVSFLVEKLGKQKAKEVFENFLIEDMEYEALSPAEKRARELEQENKNLKSEKEKAEERQKAKELDAARAKAHEDLDTEVGEALKEIGRKPTPRLVIRIVDEMMARLDAKEQAFPAKEAAKHAIKGIYADIAEYLPQLETSELIKVLPADVIEKIRQYQVEEVLGEKSQRRTKPSTPSRPKESKKMGVDEWFKNLDTKFKKQG